MTFWGVYLGSFLHCFALLDLVDVCRSLLPITMGSIHLFFCFFCFCFQFIMEMRYFHFFFLICKEIVYCTLFIWFGYYTWTVNDCWWTIVCQSMDMHLTLFIYLFCSFFSVKRTVSGFGFSSFEKISVLIECFAKRLLWKEFAIACCWCLVCVEKVLKKTVYWGN